MTTLGGRRNAAVGIPVVSEAAVAAPARWLGAPYRDVSMARWADGTLERGHRRVPEETPVAVRVDCEDYAVMLASPVDLEDFAYGFLHTEGLISRAGDVASLSLAEHDEGIVLRVERHAGQRLAAGRGDGRRLAGASGCGLCGVQSLRDAVRPVGRVTPAADVTAQAVRGAVSGLRHWQPLNACTGALHAAAFATLSGEIVTAREDVGRHNALDKLIGNMLRSGLSPESGFVVMTSRCSYELVQKAARFGVGTLCTVSAPTALAIRLAEDAGMTLIALSRPDSFVVLTNQALVD